MFHNGDPPTGFLSDEDYEFVQANMPIMCVDLVSLTPERPPRLGLILRETYGGGTGWCLVGGRVLRNEPLTTAVTRHLRTTLGARIRMDLESLTLRRVAEYFTEPDVGELHDPRKHAVALTYTAICEGPVHPQGEALEFAWFSPSALADLNFGFGQDKVVRTVLVDLGSTIW